MNTILMTTESPLKPLADWKVAAAYYYLYLLITRLVGIRLKEAMLGIAGPDTTALDAFSTFTPGEFSRHEASSWHSPAAVRPGSWARAARRLAASAEASDSGSKNDRGGNIR